MERTLNSRRTFTALGLALALAVPLGFAATGLCIRLVPRSTERSLIWGEFFIWALAGLVLLVLLFGERLDLSAVGLERPKWSTLLWGVLGFFAVLAANIVGGTMLRAIGGAPPINTIAKLAGSVPPLILLLFALRAGIVEEFLFRGYAIERLTALTGSRAAGAVVPWLVFTALHAPYWGVSYLIAIAPAGAVLTVLYLWRRDLIANMIAHFLVDASGLAVAYALAHHLIVLQDH